MFRWRRDYHSFHSNQLFHAWGLCIPQHTTAYAVRACLPQTRAGHSAAKGKEKKTWQIYLVHHINSRLIYQFPCAAAMNWEMFIKAGGPAERLKTRPNNIWTPILKVSVFSPHKSRDVHSSDYPVLEILNSKFKMPSTSYLLMRS